MKIIRDLIAATFVCISAIQTTSLVFTIWIRSLHCVALLLLPQVVVHTLSDCARVSRGAGAGATSPAGAYSTGGGLRAPRKIPPVHSGPRCAGAANLGRVQSPVMGFSSTRYVSECVVRFKQCVKGYRTRFAQCCRLWNASKPDDPRGQHPTSAHLQHRKERHACPASVWREQLNLREPGGRWTVGDGRRMRRPDNC